MILIGENLNITSSVVGEPLKAKNAAAVQAMALPR